jgi:hypothetical protein
MNKLRTRIPVTSRYLLVAGRGYIKSSDRERAPSLAGRKFPLCKRSCVCDGIRGSKQSLRTTHLATGRQVGCPCHATGCRFPLFDTLPTMISVELSERLDSTTVPVRLWHLCGYLIGISTFRSAWCRCRDDIVVSGPRGYGTVGIFRRDHH